MDRQSYTREREKGFANWKNRLKHIMILLLLLSILFIVIKVDKNDIKKYGIFGAHTYLSDGLSSKSYSEISNASIYLNSTDNSSIDTSKTIKSIIKVYDEGGRIIKEIDGTNNSNSNANMKDIQNKNNLTEGRYTVELIPQDSSIKKITLNNLEINNNTIDLGLETISNNAASIATSKKEMVIDSFAIDPSRLNFDNGTLEKTAKGNALYKCKEWNFSEQKCIGVWEKIMNLTAGQDYNISLTPQDPGFAEIIEITNAMHLDKNKTIIGDIYHHVKSLDDDWVTIPDTEYIRVTFQKNLTSNNDITIYARSNSSAAIEVYEKDSDIKIADFGIIGSESWHKIYLTNLSTPQDTFDLKITNGNDSSVDLDYIVDPTVWWNGSWSFKIPINISVVSGATPQGYQVKFFINSSSVGANWNWTNECINSNSSRARFVNSDENTTLNFWIENCSVVGQNMTAWVKIDKNITTSINTIYLYYGNPSASPYSDGNATFEFFDDFNGASVDTSKWTVGGSMTQSGGLASGTAGDRDYLFGKTRITIDTLTFIRMRSHSTTGVARPGVLQTNGNPYSTVGFGWQDWTDNLRYTDTYTTAVTQNSNYHYTTNWNNLETIWNATSVVFITDGTITNIHTTQVPTSDKVLHGQVDGNADYDLFYTRKYVPVEPTYNFGIQVVSSDINIVLDKPDIAYTNITVSSVILIYNASITSASELINCSLWDDSNGTWLRTQIVNVTGTFNTTNFSINTSGNFNWNIECCDMYTCAFAPENRTVSVGTDAIAPIVTLDSQTTSTGNYSRNWIFANISIIELNLDTIKIYLYNATGLVNKTVGTSAPLSVNFTNLPDGIYYLNATANDTYSNYGNSATNVIILDHIPPIANFYGNPVDKYISSTPNVTFEINCSDASTGISTVQLWANWTGSWNMNKTTSSYSNGILWAVNVSQIPDGTYNWGIYCNDTAGNSNRSANRTLTIDTINPSMQFDSSSIATGNYSKNYITVNVTASDNNLDTIRIYLYNSTGLVNGTVLAKSSPLTIMFTNLPNGVYYVNATVNDTAGNINRTETRVIILDTSPPIISLYGPSGTITWPFPLLNVSISDSLAGISNLWYSLNNGTTNITVCSGANCNGSDSSNPFWLHVSEGNYTVKGYANDTAGNINNASSSFTVSMNNNYYDSFNDNSSFKTLNNAIWKAGNVTLNNQKVYAPNISSANAQRVIASSAYTNKGVATDGNVLFFNDAGARIVTVGFDGTVLSTNAVSNLPNDMYQIAFAKGFLFARNSNGNIYRINISDWSSTVVTNVNVSTKPYLSGASWMTGNLFDMPDGRIGTVSNPATNPFTVRLYNVSNDGLNLIWDQDIIIDADSWSPDNHGFASDGKYLVLISYQNGHHVYDLVNGNLSSSPAWDLRPTGIANPTFITHDHVNHRYIIGDYSDYDFVIYNDSAIGTDATQGNYTSYTVNTTSTIFKIANVSWKESNTDNNNNNNISVEVSVDGGTNWYTAANNQEINQTFGGNNKSLVYRVAFNTNGSRAISLLDINISWISDISYPQFSNNLANIVSGSAYNPLNNYQFNITIMNTNGTAGIEFDGVNYNLVNSSHNFMINVSNLAAGNYSYYFWAYGNGSSHWYNYSSIYNYTITKATPVLLFLANGGTNNLNLTYPEQINISASASAGTLSLEKDGIDYSAYNGLNVILEIGNYTFRANITGNQNYSNVDYLYYNVTINPIYVDTQPPTITLLQPLDGTGDSGDLTQFSYIVSDESNISNCTLVIDGAVQDFSDNVSKDMTQEFGAYHIIAGLHNWNINCTDIHGNENSSTIRQVTIVPSYDFSGKTTDLSNVDIENITQLIVEQPSYGIINFSTTINLSGGANFNQYITISNNLISIDSSKLPQLNKSATLTIYNLSFAKPIILKNNEPCTDCAILNYDGDLTFTVHGFSTYSASENSQLHIWDDTDNKSGRIQNQINFYANYTNKTSGKSINGSGIYCNITFSDIGTKDMMFNSSTKLYTFNRTFSTAGVYYYDITCEDSNNYFASVNATDYANIIDLGGPQSPSNITVIKSERANISNPPAEIASQAGNLTQLNIDADAITRSWQGYYGKVIGEITLKDSSGATLYNWNITQPKGEVYATRASDANFANINCSTTAEIINEETYIGQNSTDADSVRNTFNKSNHPQFSIGNIDIEANTCKATNLYADSSAQNSTFYEILLSDGASNLVYTALLDPNKIGFDNQLYDFQMLVGENGRDEAITTYYFFVEIY